MGSAWVEKNKNIEDLVNNEMVVHIKWDGKPDKDYIELSKQYINAGYLTLKEVIEVEHNSNIKYDMWFLPGIYMVRQAIELLIKGGIAYKGATKKELETIFNEHKHNVKALYEVYKVRNGTTGLNNGERIWLEQYLGTIEVVDSSSDLFRYPFRDPFMEQYGDKALDVYHMGNRLLNCYSIINKMIFNKWHDNDPVELEEEPKFLELAISGVNNCYLWNSPWSDEFHRQVTGYSEVADFLYHKFEETKDKRLFYPIVFLMRNAIEIGLKRLLHLQMDKKVDEHIIRRKRNSHLLYKDLWRSIKPMVVHYANLDNQDKETIDIAESYIKSLKSIDKNGDMFRYPCSYSCEYRYNNKDVDVKNYFNYLLGIFNFINGVDAWLGHISTYEMEMRSEWEAEMRSEWEAEMRSYMDDYNYDY